MTPDRPWYWPAGCTSVVNTDSVLCPPAWITRSTAMIRNTAISKMPRIVPSRADARMPK